MAQFGSKLAYLIRQRSLQVALLLWVLICLGTLWLCHGTMPLPIGPHPDKPAAQVISSSIAIVFLVLEAGLVALITRRRPVPDLAERAPERATGRFFEPNRAGHHVSTSSFLTESIAC